VSRSVFISHAVADKPLVEAFVRFLEDAIGVAEDEIFCVSIPGMGIPTGTPFVNYIRDEMERPALVIMLITPNYLASSFCQGEMGAAWIKGHRIVPPATFADVTGVFLGVQAVRIEDDVRVNELKDLLVEVLKFTPKSTSRWDMERKKFFRELGGIIALLPAPKTVLLQVHEELQAKYDDALKEMNCQEDELKMLREKIAALAAAKDATAVAAIAARFDTSDVGDKLVELLKTAKGALANLGPPSLRLHVLAQYYDKPFDLSREDREPFEAAERRNLLTDDWSLRHESQPIKRAADALDAVDAFVHANEEELERYATREFNAPLETNNEDFWREHLV
jgi:hypothetical protein